MRATSNRRKVTVLCALLGLVIVLVQLRIGGGGEGEREIAFDPQTANWVRWEELLGGDSAGEGAGFAAVVRRVDGLSDLGEQAEGALRLGREVAYAAISGEREEQFPRYFAQNHARVQRDARAGGCTDVVIHAVSAARMEVPVEGVWAKILVGFSAVCPQGPVERVAYLYAELEASRGPEQDVAKRFGGWVPRHSVQVPGATAAWEGLGALPSAYELATLEDCAEGRVEVRIEVALGFSSLCQSARAAGVRIVAVEGLRSVREQAVLYAKERARSGSDAVARRKVAYADENRCESRHCTGEAIDVRGDAKAMAWLGLTVGCLRGTRIEALTGAGCASGAVSVDNAMRHGFVRPLRGRGEHLVWALGTTQIDAGRWGDCNPGATMIETRIKLVFTCRVLEAGFDEQTAARVAQEAVAVARCASGLDPEARSQGGRFEDRANPVTGETDDRAGLFAIGGAAAEVWVAGGGTARNEIGANIDAAARMWVHTESFGRWGWSMFACATGEDGITEPVL